MAIRDLVPRTSQGRGLKPDRRGETEPFRDFQRQMNRLFDDFFGETALAPGWGARALGTVGFSPRVDVSETDRDVKISAELPGMDEKDITVELGDSAIAIRGERKEEKEDKGKNWHTREQSYGAFHRIVPLPATVEAGKAAARFRKGVLTVMVPKREADKARRKTVKIETD